jgi:hypothetical protein
MPYSVAFKNKMLDQAVSFYGTIYGSIHTVSGITTPGSAGINEATGGTPAYARQALAFSAAGGGLKALSAVPTWNLPAGTYGYFGMWSALTSGTWLGYEPITQFTLSAQDIYSLLSGSLSQNATASA